MRPATTTTTATTAAPAADISASAPRQTPAAARPTTPQPDEATVSRMRRLSAKTRNMRLVHAAGKRAVGQLRALLAAGADVGARAGLEGRTALHWASRRGDVEAARLLLEAGAAVDAREIKGKQRTPLHLAAEEGGAAVARLLLRATADPNARDCRGWRPLHLAAAYGQAEVAAALLDAGADRGATTGDDGETALDIARESGYRRVVEMLS
ncbi:poly [ADP-ribose] polymerase tankyrase-1-like [Schistocerca cancellata]|uniref:poly [ADP-ribose] polymerase tankyrase-1-like n=1 Tax=Schistocerca cancellata TaxID=274614 RepID=UPI00211875A1|nr:poly [ADP-ribose] polymerase tankyrase-1-like [Schistocerca cancellata]